MILGQSAATAPFVLEAKVDVQSLSYEDLKKKLLDGRVLELERKDIVSYGVVLISLFQELLWMTQVRNSQASGFVSSSLRPFVGNCYYHDGNTGKGMRSANFPFKWIKKDYMKFAYPFFLMVIGQEK